ncbi:hypothetical protein ACN47E_000385 [Coniothyrium glycines]
MVMVTTAENQIATAWLAPPPGLTTANHKVMVEPVSITFSAVVASVAVILVAIILMTKSKDNYARDTVDVDDTTQMTTIQEIAATTHELGRGGIVRTPLVFQAGNHSTSTHGNLEHQNRMEDDGDSSAHRRVESHGQAIGGYGQERDWRDDTTLADNDDRESLGSEGGFSRFEETLFDDYRLRPGYANSFVPSEFRPLRGSVVGMHGPVWRAQN